MVQRDRTKHSPRPESVTRSGAVFCLISGQWENMQIFWIYLPQDKDKTVCKIFHLLPIHFVCYNLAIEVMMVQEHGFIIFFQIMLSFSRRDTSKSRVDSLRQFLKQCNRLRFIRLETRPQCAVELFTERRNPLF